MKKKINHKCLSEIKFWDYTVAFGFINKNEEYNPE